MSDYVVRYADLSAIQHSINNLNNNLHVVNENILSTNRRVDTVDENVRVVFDQLSSLARDFYEFVREQNLKDNKSDSQQTLIRLNQEAEKRFGHYEIVRRTTTGILQADDLGLVRKETITTATEELMLSTPGYWLTPCLVALAAWINDQRDLAEKALLEGIRRDDGKSSLFWTLVCRRADRKGAALKWMQRYLDNQDETNLDRQTVVILDAFASGLLGADSEGVISKQMTTWLDRLASKPGFIKQQTQQWSDAISLKKKPYAGEKYPYLRKYSKTWPALQQVMEGACLHADILAYFIDIFEQESSTDSLKKQLDDILTSLVSEFDNEELPIRRQQKYHELVIEFDGDTDRAKRHMQVEQSALEERKDFTQLLTDAAMNPKSSHASPSTQKFAIALSKSWISNAYTDLVAQNRAAIPHEITINVDTFNDKTVDGRDEAAVLGRFNALVDREQEQVLSGCEMTGFAQFCLWGGLAIMILGIILAVTGSAFLGIIGIIAGIGMVINHFSKKGEVDERRNNIIAQFDEKRQNGTKVIRAMMAEIVDFRAEFAARDKESEKVEAFLEQISPDQYVKKLSDSGRRINVSN